MPPEMTFEEFLDWLDQHGFRRQFQTQLGHLMPDLADVKASRPLLDALRTELILRIQCSAVDTTFRELRTLHDRLASFLVPLRKEVRDDMPIPRSERLPTPQDTRSSAVRELERCLATLERSEEYEPLAEAGLPARALVERRTTEIRSVRRNCRIAADAFGRLAQRCAYVPPAGTEVLDELARICATHEQFVGTVVRAWESTGSKAAQALLLLAHRMAAGAFDEGLVADVDDLASRYSSPMGPDTLLQEVWEGSLAAWPGGDLGVDPRAGFLQAFTRKALFDPAWQQRWVNWLMAHGRGTDATTGTSGKQVVLMQVATCCTLVRWARANGAEKNADMLLGRILKLTEDSVVDLPRAWCADLGLPRTLVLRKLFNVVDGIRRDPDSRPRLASRLATVPARLLPSLVRLSDSLLERRPLVWPVALASKIAFFYSIVEGYEPEHADRSTLQRLMSERIARIAAVVRPAKTEQLVVEQYAARVYAEAPARERFSSSEWGPRRDTWMFGEAVEGDVEEVACGDEALASQAKDLFCRPCIEIHETTNARVLQVLVNLAAGSDYFRETLWWPMRLPAEDVRREKRFHIYFGFARSNI